MRETEMMEQAVEIEYFGGLYIFTMKDANNNVHTCTGHSGRETIITQHTSRRSGRVCWHSLNLKGNTHDSTACIPLYDFLIREQPVEKILADSAFSDQVGVFPLNKRNLRNTLNGYSLVSRRQSVEHVQNTWNNVKKMISIPPKVVNSAYRESSGGLSSCNSPP